MEIMETIVKKAQKGKEYGQLLKAQLRHANLQMEISPDSLTPVMERLEKQTLAAEKKDAAYGAVMHTVAAVAYKNNYALGDERGEKANAHYKKVFQDVKLLAKTPAGRFAPLVEKGVDSEIYNHDLLSLLGMCAADHGYWEANRLMHDYYDGEGRRVAAMLLAHKMYEDIDSLIERYKDLPECGYLAESKIGRIYNTGEKLQRVKSAASTIPARNWPMPTMP